MTFQVLFTMTVLVILVSPCTDASSCFIKRLFDFNYPQENVYNIALNKDPNSLNNVVLAYGDFNNDLHSDYVALDTNTGDLLVFFYQSSGSSNGLYTVQNILQPFKGCVPLNVYLYDANDDNLLDITVWGKQNTTNCLYLNLQTTEGSFIQGVASRLNLFPTTQPILFETNGILGAKTSCLLFYQAEAQARKIVYYALNSYNFLSWAQWFLGNYYENVPFSDQHWNSFIDLTGDCSPELVLTNSKGQIEFWIYTRTGYELATVKILDTELGIKKLRSMTFIDINYNGQQDLILANDSSILLYLNTQQTPSQFCLSGKIDFGFDWSNSIQITSVDSCLIGEQNIKFADLDINGYPDLLLSCQSDGYEQIKILKNSFDQSTEMFSSFSTYQDPVNEFVNKYKYQSARVNLFDILENGIIDFMITVNQNQTIALYNNYLYQNYFYIKGYGTNGHNSTAGALISGATFYWLNSLGNSQRTAVYSQLFQTAYGAVPMPYVLTGLGRANNYVEQFTIGRLGDSKSWSPIIPNSQLALYTGEKYSSNWQIKIFTTPTDSLVYVLIVCIVILTVLGLILVILKCKKKKEENIFYQGYA